LTETFLSSPRRIYSSNPSYRTAVSLLPSLALGSEPLPRAGQI
jgi:hypothetical protein